MAYMAGIDVGGTKIAIGIATHDGSLLGQRRLITAELGLADQALDHMALEIQALCREISIDLGQIQAIGIGTPGPLKKGTLLHSANISQWEGVNWASGISLRLRLPAFVQNDATAAAIGEWMFGAGRGSRDMAYVTVSTGIGSGIIAHGQPYAGVDGNAGELGHVVVEPNGPLCQCGNHGCLEALASGTAMARRAEEMRDGSDFLKGRGRLTAEDVFSGLSVSDSVCRQIVDDAAQYLGLGLSYLVNLLNPECIVVGGGVMAHSGDAFFERVEKAMRQYSMKELVAPAKLVRAGLGDQSGLVGAIAVAIAGQRLHNA